MEEGPSPSLETHILLALSSQASELDTDLDILAEDSCKNITPTMEKIYKTRKNEEEDFQNTCRNQEKTG